ncbi:ANT(3'')-Ia family aminoglycoside nucleotidyltransferase AadA1 [Ravibacter arvi]|uniref:ANT(3'')-Ia family aminoglycoside nucleotidyltransferase AadA1 n=1 Tax=Ravibacter arvi TaxID=2051041 RepID=A0ABP8LXQ7_9BACT
MKITDSRIPSEILPQLSLAVEVVRQHLSSKLLAIHLYGSALDGGLKRYSDIDVLVTINEGLDEALRKALITDLLKISAPPGESRILRALEVTVVVLGDVVPWRYPAVRHLQFGEWQRKEIIDGIFDLEVSDPDLAILLTKAGQKSIALFGPPAATLFDPIPERDFYAVLSDTLNLWKSPPDWENDERNVVLTLARIWYSAATGMIASKDFASAWALERLPGKHASVLSEAQRAYLGQVEDRLALKGNEVAETIAVLKNEIAGVLRSKPGSD